MQDLTDMIAHTTACVTQFVDHRLYVTRTLVLLSLSINQSIYLYLYNTYRNIILYTNVYKYI